MCYLIIGFATAKPSIAGQPTEYLELFDVLTALPETPSCYARICLTV